MTGTTRLLMKWLCCPPKSSYLSTQSIAAIKRRSRRYSPSTPVNLVLSQSLSTQNLVASLSPSLKKDKEGLEDQDVQDVFEALSSPVQTPVSTVSQRIGPFSMTQSKLSPDYLKNLRIKFDRSSKGLSGDSLPLPIDPEKSDTESKQEILSLPAYDLPELEKKNSSLLKKSKTPSLQEISHVIHLNALAQRPEEAQKAFDLLETLRIKPDLISYNHLMNAYSRTQNLGKVKEIFDHLNQETCPTLKPDVVTYSTLIKTLVNGGETRHAFAIYDEMTKEKKIPSNRIVFTTLIKGAIKDKDIQRAWKTFDHMRSQVCEPDTLTYSLMIHACSLTQDVEKAFDLFEEMTSKNLAVTEATFVALIRSCGSRPDYYLESFTIFEQMMRQGIHPTVHTYNMLLYVASKQGDIVRARLIWNQMMSEHYKALRKDCEENDNSLISKEHEPNTFSFTYMFSTYAKAISKSRKLNKEKIEVLNEESKAAMVASKEAVIDPSTIDLDDHSSSPDHDQLDLTSSFSQNLLLNNPNRSPTGLFEEAERLWNVLNNPQALEPPLPCIKKDKFLLGSYLNVLASYPTCLTTIEKSIKFFKEAYVEYGLQTNGINRLVVLHAITRNKEAFNRFGHGFWVDFVAWDAEREKSLDPELLPRERERIRVIEGRGQDIMVKAFINMIQGYTRVGEYNKALDLIQEAQLFRYNGYLRPLLFRDVWSLVEAMRDEAEDGKWDGFERLMSLCAKPDSSPLQAVRSTLKLRNLPKNWWGWRALGMDENDLRRIQKKNSKEKQKILLRNWAKSQRKAHKPIHPSASR